MAQRIVQVDAFTARPFAGNPAAVCVLERAAPEDWMQAVAREMNLSETAFLHPRADGFALRWFTPETEVDLCGHATLASAHVLWQDGWLAADQQARFHTRSGLLTADRDGVWIRLDFPAKPPTTAQPPANLQEALGGIDFEYVGRNEFDYLVALESEDVLRKLKPNFWLLGQVAARGVIVTAPSSSLQFDFVSRFFAPVVGINEDPVTGSAHCCLTPYWAGRLRKQEMKAYQASARGGVLRVALRGERVWLCGEAITVLRGELSASG